VGKTQTKLAGLPLIVFSLSILSSTHHHCSATRPARSPSRSQSLHGGLIIEEARTAAALARRGVAEQAASAAMSPGMGSPRPRARTRSRRGRGARREDGRRHASSRIDRPAQRGLPACPPPPPRADGTGTGRRRRGGGHVRGDPASHDA
jgi:hypothetical protein